MKLALPDLKEDKSKKSAKKKNISNVEDINRIRWERDVEFIL